MKSLTRVALAAIVVAIAGASNPVHANDLDYDHLKCFKIRDSLVDRRTIYLADIYPQAPLAARADCRIRLPASHFCVNVAKEEVQVNGEPFDTFPVDADSGRDYLCYDLKCDRDRRDVDAFDQFGARTLRIRKSDFLCMPANKIPPPTPAPTDTPTPMPTMTPEPMGCQFDQGPDANGNILGTCGGDCEPGSVCASTTGPNTRTVDCQCVPEDALCGEQLDPPANEAPVCGGACISPFTICQSTTGSASGGRPVLECSCVPF